MKIYKTSYIKKTKTSSAIAKTQTQITNQNFILQLQYLFTFHSVSKILFFFHLIWCLFFKPEFYTAVAVLVFFLFSLKDFFLISFALVNFFKPDLYFAVAVHVFFAFSLKEFFSSLLVSFVSLSLSFILQLPYLFSSHLV